MIDELLTWCAEADLDAADTGSSTARIDREGLPITVSEDAARQLVSVELRLALADLDEVSARELASRLDLAAPGLVCVEVSDPGPPLVVTISAVLHRSGYSKQSALACLDVVFKLARQLGHDEARLRSTRQWIDEVRAGATSN